MKAALVLFCDHASFLEQAGEINEVFTPVSGQFSQVALWLFSREQPKNIPVLGFAVSAVKWIFQKDPLLPETCLHALWQVAGQDRVDLMVFASDGLGEELATRLAYRLKGSSCLQVKRLALRSGRLRVVKPLYGNHLTGELALAAAPFCLSAARQPCCPAKTTP